MFAVVGLGNPDSKYFDTRHNVGFRAIDLLSSHWDIPLLKTGRHSVYGVGRAFGKEIILAKPTTYMNRSGLAVHELANEYALLPENFLIIYDDMNLPIGYLRIRPKGSAGGHNGLESIIEKIGTMDIPRLRIGIGGPEPDESSVDYVLSPVPDDSMESLDSVLDRASCAIKDILLFGIEESMGKYNKRVKEENEQ